MVALTATQGLARTDSISKSSVAATRGPCRRESAPRRWCLCRVRIPPRSCRRPSPSTQPPVRAPGHRSPGDGCLQLENGGYMRTKTFLPKRLRRGRLGRVRKTTCWSAAAVTGWRAAGEDAASILRPISPSSTGHPSPFRRLAQPDPTSLTPVSPTIELRA